MLPLRIFKPHLPPQNTDELKTWAKYHQQLLAPAETPALHYKKCCLIFDLYIQSYAQTDKIMLIISGMKNALNIAMRINDLQLAAQEFTKATLFANKHSWQTFWKYPWANKTQLRSTATIMSTISSLTTLANEAGWSLLAKIPSNQKQLKKSIQINLANLATYNAQSHLESITFLYSEFSRSTSTMERGLLKSGIHFLLTGLEAWINQFRDKRYNFCIRATNNDPIYAVDEILDKALSTIQDLRAELAPKPEVIQPELTPAATDKPSSPLPEQPSVKNDHKAPISPYIPISSPVLEDKPKLSRMERERERKRLKKIAKLEQMKPQCYNTPDLRVVVDEIADIIQRSACEGGICGSSIYKNTPNDIDILLPEITADETRLEALIASFEASGWEETTMGHAPGKRGYIKDNRHVIPMQKNQKKIEFSVSSDTYLEHTKKRDFTVNEKTYDLKQMKMLPTISPTALQDYKNKTINTILDPVISFANDPSRIFRAIRLITAEGFHFSPACEEAIKTLFSGEGNLFNTMAPGKLYYQLNLLYDSGYEKQNLTILHESGLLSKLYQVLSKRDPERDNVRALRFIKYYKEVYPELTQDWIVPQRTRSTSSLQQYSHFQASSRSPQSDVSISPTFG